MICMAREGRHVVLLLREKKDPEDQYEKALNEKGHITLFVPVLKFEFVCLEELYSALSQPLDYSGLVFTSQVAVDAVSQSIALFEGVEGHKSSVLLKWKPLPIFVVGPATKEQVQKALCLEVTGDHSGNAGALSQLIIEYFRPHPSSLPLLFPCGDLRKDTLPSVLSEAGIGLQTITCYRTVPRPFIEEDLKKKLDALPTAVVFFSPSGVQFAFSTVKNMILDKSSVVKVCAIGPSTEEALKKQFSSTCNDVLVAKKPCPEELLKLLT